jgi:DNA polymerase-1
MMRPTLLIDGNNILIRAVEATRRSAMHSDDGTDTSALVVFIKTISRYIREEKPYRVMVIWDSGPDWRKQIYPAYKANRPQHTDEYRSGTRRLVREFLFLARVPWTYYPGYEADDLIGMMWRHATEPVVILSSDKDMLQLVGETPTGHPCTQIRVSSSNTPTDRWDEKKVIEHYGCTPAQRPLVMSLTGDASDGIPGVKGIGDVKALKHLTAAGWDLAAVDHPPIAEARDNGEIAIYRQLVDLRDPPYETAPDGRISPFMPVTPGPDAAWQALWAFLNRYQLRDIERRLLAGELW